MNVSRSSPLKSPRKSLHRQRTARELSADEVKSRLEEALSLGQQRFTQVVRQILEDSKSETAEPCRKALFEFCINAVNQEQLHSKTTKEVIECLRFEVEQLKGPSLIELAELLIKGVKEGKHQSLDLFPKFVSVIAAQEKIQYQKEGGGFCEMEGFEQKSHLLNSLCSYKWEPSCVLHIADMCKDISMTLDELEFLMEKILRVMKSLCISELPPLVFQLLGLSGKGHRVLVLEGLKALFNQLDQEILTEQEDTEMVMETSGSRTELLQAEGTAIVHITHSLKHDKELRKEFEKSLKAAHSRLSGVLSPFSVALSLSVARIHRFEDPAFGFFKEVVVGSFKDEDRKRASRWMQEVHQDSVDIEKILMDTIEHSASGWDAVVDGLVWLGFNLMETYAPKNSSVATGTPQFRACSLGSKIIFNTFKMHKIVHLEVVNQIINRILTNASAYVGHYIDLLSSIVSTTPHAALDAVPQLKEAFDYLSLLQPAPAIELLHAVLPLVQYSSSVRDSLLLVLRKSLFSRKLEARKIAVGGYLLLLKKFTVLDSVSTTDSETSQCTLTGSQVMVEVHSAPSGNAALCLEILGTLRRALTKQYDVRLSLYEGLYTVFCANAKLSEPIVTLLVGQFDKYYEKEPDITPPVKLDPCIAASGGEIHKLEPLDHLIQCLQLCTSKYSEWEARKMETENGDGDGGEAPAVIEDAQDILQSMLERMGKSEPEDFELDKSSDFSVASSVGQKNRVFARLVMGLYETLLEYTFTIGEFSQASCEQTLKLYRCYQRVSDIMQEKSSSSSGGGASKRGPSTSSSSTASNKTEHSCLSLQFVIRLLRAIFSDSSPNHQQPLSVIREAHDFVRYVLNVAVQKIKQIHEKGTCDGSFAQHRPEKMFKYCCQLARVLFKQVDTGASVGTAKKEKGKSVAVLCLEGFFLMLQAVAARFNSKEHFSMTLEGFLAAVNPAIGEGTALSERIHFFIKHFQRLVSHVLEGSSRGWSMKEIQIMVNTIGLLASELDTDSQEMSEVYEWTSTQCKKNNIDDTQATKALVSLLLTLDARQKETPKTIRRLAIDIHYQLGDIEEDVELEAEQTFAIVNPRTAGSSILSLVYSHVDQLLVDADWLISKLKFEMTSRPAEDLFEMQSSPTHTQAKDLCSSLCERLTSVVEMCNELTQTNLVAGSLTEGLLKTLIKLFNVLANLAKYTLALYQHISHILPKFRSLVTKVGAELSQQVYLFLYYLQTAQTAGDDEGDTSVEKGKKGGKGKSKATSSGKAQVRKETRFFPNLIFAMEQFEKFIIQLDSKAKDQLMQHFKRSTSRDFRINAKTVSDILNEEEDEEGEDESCCEEEGSGEGGDDAPPKAKKLKRS